MINILKIVLLRLFNLLPDSPFRDFSKNIDMTDYQYINWILPVDICCNIMLGWLVCISVYYLFLIVKRFANKIIDVIAKGVKLASYFV